MKIQFSMTIKGEDIIYEKFVKTIESHPTVQMDLIKAFAQTIMMAFRLNAEDNVTIESFRAGRVQEESEQKPQEIPVEEEKKVEN